MKVPKHEARFSEQIPWPPPPHEPRFDVSLVFGVGSDGVRCRTITVEARKGVAPPPRVTGALLRELRLADLTREFAHKHARILRNAATLADGKDEWFTPLADVVEPPLRPDPGSRHAQVAAIYRQAKGLGEPPTRAVQQAFPGATYAQAASWVKRARKNGDIPQVPK